MIKGVAQTVVELSEAHLLVFANQMTSLAVRLTLTATPAKSASTESANPHAKATQSVVAILFARRVVAKYLRTVNKKSV